MCNKKIYDSRYKDYDHARIMCVYSSNLRGQKYGLYLDGEIYKFESYQDGKEYILTTIKIDGKWQPE